MEQESESNIQVAIRVRPMLQKEHLKKLKETVKVEQNQVVVFDPIDLKMEQEGKQKMDVIH